jgi:leucyl-tRNA synthetase
MRKWLDRVYRLLNNNRPLTNDVKKIGHNLDQAYHRFINEVTAQIENHNFNVAISKMMVYINVCYSSPYLYKPHIAGFISVLSCFAPHLAEEI